MSWDGRLRQVNLADGQDVAPPEKFMPGGGKPYALNLHNGVIYTATAQGCGGLTNAFYSFDLASQRASAFIPAGGGLWGRRGARSHPRAGSIIGTGDAQFDPQNQRLGNGIVGVKLDANKQLQLGRLLRRAERELAVAPRPRRQHDAGRCSTSEGRKFLVGTSKECRLWLLDRDALGGEDHRTTLHTTPLICNDAQAFDAPRRLGRAQRVAGRERHAVGAGAVLGAGEHGVQGADRARAADGRRRRRVQAAAARGKLAARRRRGCRATWISPRRRSSRTASCSPMPPARMRRRSCPTRRGTSRAARSTAAASAPVRRGAFPTSRRAALYALDGQTGKELWSSGTQIESWNHFSGLTVANGRAYIATFDGVALLLRSR